MKKLFTLLLTLTMLLSLSPITVFAETENPDISAFELPKPAAPHYMMFEAADRTVTEGDDALYIIRKTDMSVLALSTEEYQDRDAFLKKYGLYDFCIIMQYDSSLDGTDNWNYTSDWDTEYSAPDVYEATAIAWIGEDLIDKETLFDLYECEPDGKNYRNMSDAIIHRAVPDGDYTFDNYYFDHENHSLYIRCRYYMEWETYDGETIGKRQSKFSEWSDVAVFGKDSTAITPDEPTGYEAPVISNLAYKQPDEGAELGCLTYILNTPESVWNAAIYYEMTQSGDFDTLETQISIDDGDWQPYDTVNGWGDWSLSAGIRTAYAEEPRIEADTNVRLRVRYTGAHGASEWSNILEINDSGTQEVPNSTPNGNASSNATQNQGGNSQNNTVKPDSNTPEKDKCKLCGFCPMLLGLCIFIWIAIILLIIILLIIIIFAAQPKKCKRCGEKLDKNIKYCPRCGKPTK